MQQTIRVLLIENRPTDAEKVFRVIEQTNCNILCYGVDTVEQARSALMNTTYDVILAGNCDSDAQIEKTISTLEDCSSCTPVIFINNAYEAGKPSTIGYSSNADMVFTCGIDNLATAMKQAQECRTPGKSSFYADQSPMKRASMLESILTSTTEFAIAATDLDFRIIHYNPAAETLFGQKAENLVGKTVQEIREQESNLPARFIRTTEIKESEGVTAYETTTRDSEGENRLIHTTVMPLRGQEGKHIGYVLFSKDITRERQAQEQRNQLVAAIEQSAEAIAVTNSFGIIQYANSAFKRINGYDTGEVIGQVASILKCHDSETDLSDAVWEKLKADLPWHGRCTETRKDHTPYIADVTVSPIHDELGIISNYVITTRDVTHEIAIEEQLLQSQKLEAVETLANGIAHDFNNLLTAIFGYTSVAKNSLSKEHHAVEALEMVEQAARQAGSVVDSLLAFTHRGNVEKSKIDLGQLISDSINLLRHALPASIQITEDIARDTWVNANGIQMQQMLMNLAVNSRDSMPNGGKLKITVRNEPVALSEIAPKNSDADRFVLIEVEDNGTGMTSEVLTKATEPFFTTKPRVEGSGLGLSIVHGFVDDHGGRMEIRSEEGSGTKISIALPSLQTGECSPLQVADNVTTEYGSADSIELVVADELIGSIMLSSLNSSGYRNVQVTNDSATFKTLFQQNKTPSLVIVDLNLLQQTAQSFVHNINSIYGDLPIIFISEGENGKLIENRDKRVYVLQKPFEMSEFVECVKASLTNLEPAKEIASDK